MEDFVGKMLYASRRGKDVAGTSEKAHEISIFSLMDTRTVAEALMMTMRRWEKEVHKYEIEGRCIVRILDTFRVETINSYQIRPQNGYGKVIMFGESYSWYWGLVPRKEEK